MLISSLILFCRAFEGVRNREGQKFFKIPETAPPRLQTYSSQGAFVCYQQTKPAL